MNGSRNHTHHHHRARTRGHHLALQQAAVGVLLVAAATVLALRLLVPAQPPVPEGWSTVSVQQSGTLWELASNHPVPGLTTAETVEYIEDENSLDSPVLYAGQSLRVPANDRQAAAELAAR